MKHGESTSSRKLLFAVLMAIVIFLIGLAGFLFGRNSRFSKTNVEKSRRLLISAVTDDTAGFTTISPEELGGNYKNDIVYLDLTDVSIEIDGTPVKLEYAIRNGAITVEEISAYAQIDARNGICSEIFESNHGLTHFTYRYPEFDLRLTYDVYETPDGKQHLIHEIGLYKVGSDVVNTYTDDQSAYNYRLDREDWGISLDIVEATSTSVTLACAQSGGQHFGELEIDFYSIYLSDQYKPVPTLDGIDSIDDFTPNITIEQNTNSQFTIDWTDTYGELASGDYFIELHIFDIYEESQIHPLTDNFYDTQEYYLPFSIS